jgi:hypothetical protein
VGTKAKEKPPKGGFFFTTSIMLVLWTGIRQCFASNAIFDPRQVKGL